MSSGWWSPIIGPAAHQALGRGGTAHLIIYPDAALVVAALVNSDYTFIGALSRFAEPFLVTQAGR